MQGARIIAHFHPQAWYNDYAIDVDCEGLALWDVTDDILALGRDAALKIVDDDYTSDDLRFSENAPAWVREWNGPFYIEVSQSIADYFGAD